MFHVGGSRSGPIYSKFIPFIIKSYGKVWFFIARYQYKNEYLYLLYKIYLIIFVL
jgi:hypothetical protein